METPMEVNAPSEVYWPCVDEVTESGTVTSMTNAIESFESLGSADKAPIFLGTAKRDIVKDKTPACYWYGIYYHDQWPNRIQRISLVASMRQHLVAHPEQVPVWCHFKRDKDKKGNDFFKGSFMKMDDATKDYVMSVISADVMKIVRNEIIPYAKDEDLPMKY